MVIKKETAQDRSRSLLKYCINKCRDTFTEEELFDILRYGHLIFHNPTVAGIHYGEAIKMIDKEYEKTTNKSRGNFGTFLDTLRKGRARNAAAHAAVNQGLGTVANAVEITVNLSEKVVDALKGLTSDRGVTVTEALRRAISTEKFLADEVKKGNRILIEDENGKMREVILR